MTAGGPAGQPAGQAGKVRRSAGQSGPAGQPAGQSAGRTAGQAGRAAGRAGGPVDLAAWRAAHPLRLNAEQARRAANEALLRRRHEERHVTHVCSAAAANLAAALTLTADVEKLREALSHVHWHQAAGTLPRPPQMEERERQHAKQAVRASARAAAGVSPWTDDGETDGAAADAGEELRPPYPAGADRAADAGYGTARPQGAGRGRVVALHPPSADTPPAPRVQVELLPDARPAAGAEVPQDFTGVRLSVGIFPSLEKWAARVQGLVGHDIDITAAGTGDIYSVRAEGWERVCQFHVQALTDGGVLVWRDIE